MSRIITITLLSGCLLISGLLFSSFEVSAEEKPQLSVAIRNMIDSKGVDATIKYFAKDYAENKNHYQVDQQGIVELGTNYIRVGNPSAGQAVFYIGTPYINDWALAMRNAKAEQQRATLNDTIKKVAARNKERAKEIEQARVKGAAERQAADDERAARYEAQRNSATANSGATTVKLTSEDKWYIIRSLNIDAKGVSIMSSPATLHEKALAAGFKGSMNSFRSAYTKGPVKITANFYPEWRKLVKTLRYELSNLPPAQWHAYINQISSQLGIAAPQCQLGNRLYCALNFTTSAHHVDTNISSQLLKGRGSITIYIRQGYIRQGP